MRASSVFPKQRATEKAKRRPFAGYESGPFWSELQGLTAVIPEPKFTKLVFPSNITTRSSKELGRLLSKYTALAGYYDGILAKAELDYDLSRQHLAYLKSRNLLLAKGRTIAERKAYRLTRPAIVAATQKMLKAKALYVMLLTYRRICDKYRDCVYREMSRRVER